MEVLLIMDIPFPALATTMINHHTGIHGGGNNNDTLFRTLPGVKGSKPGITGKL